ILLQKSVSLHGDALFGEICHHVRDGCNRPAEHGVRLWGMALYLLNAQVHATSIEYAGKGILLDEIEPKNSLIESAGFGAIDCHAERHNLRSTKHSSDPVLFTVKSVNDEPQTGNDGQDERGIRQGFQHSPLAGVAPPAPERLDRPNIVRPASQRSEAPRLRRSPTCLAMGRRSDARKE